MKNEKWNPGITCSIHSEPDISPLKFHESFPVIKRHTSLFAREMMKTFVQGIGKKNFLGSQTIWKWLHHL
jgi:hypothetical protein